MLPRGTHPLVLVADDYADARELLVELLKHSGIPTVSARDGGEALALARERRPALVLLDLAMPVLSGWEVAAALKADDATRDIRIFACTAHDQQEVLERAQRAGCEGVFVKPLDLQAILRLARSLVEAEEQSELPL